MTDVLRQVIADAKAGEDNAGAVTQDLLAAFNSGTLTVSEMQDKNLFPETDKGLTTDESNALRAKIAGVINTK